MRIRWNQCIGVALLWVSCVFGAVAQDAQADRFARIEKEKKAYITKQLSLTSSEAKNFFPIYEQYRTELTLLQRERRRVRTSDAGQRGATSRPLRNERFQRDLVPNPDRDMIAFDAKRLELKKNYRERFANAIGLARASQFFEVEEEFNEYLMRHLQNRQSGPAPQRP